MVPNRATHHIYLGSLGKRQGDKQKLESFGNDCTTTFKKYPLLWLQSMTSQPAITCWNLTIKTLKQGVECVQS